MEQAVAKVRRCTNEEKARRIDQVRKWLTARKTRTEINRLCEKKFKIKWQHANEYMKLAREAMAAASGKAEGEARQDAISFYEGVIADPKSSELAKMRAQENLDKIFANHAPAQIRVGDPNGNPLAAGTQQSVIFVLPQKVVDAPETKEIEG